MIFDGGRENTKISFLKSIFWSNALWIAKAKWQSKIPSIKNITKVSIKKTRKNGGKKHEENLIPFACGIDDRRYAADERYQCQRC